MGVLKIRVLTFQFAIFLTLSGFVCLVEWGPERVCASGSEAWGPAPLFAQPPGPNPKREPVTLELHRYQIRSFQRISVLDFFACRFNNFY